MRGGGNIRASIARLRRAGPKRIRRSLVTSSAPRSVLAACWIFCSEKELTNLTGHPPPEWPLVVVKELVDNAIDACEGAGIAPVVSVTVDAEALAFRYDTICADHAIPLLVVHDFDKSGLSRAVAGCSAQGLGGPRSKKRLRPFHLAGALVQRPLVRKRQ
jgi:hypothetical protein